MNNTELFKNILLPRLVEVAPRIQVILGPRQVGKTTAIKAVLAQQHQPYHYASADDLLIPAVPWLREQWAKAALLCRNAPERRAILVIDEVQKILEWSEALKSLWDNKSDDGLRVVLLGSSSLRIQTGLSESLAGRFEVIRAYHWGLVESHEAFGFSLDDYLTFGGYPGASQYRHDFARWYQYVKESIIDAVLMKDILGLRNVTKPALFRQCFQIACAYPAQEVSYTKLLGQLQDRGNTDLVKHYLELFEGAYLIKSLLKYSPKPVIKKSSSPKILPLCPALVTIALGPHLTHVPEMRGRLLELAVGADLCRLPGDLFYWRERGVEVDYVYAFAGELFAVEVKSGRQKSTAGLAEFCRRFKNAKPVLITEANYKDFAQNPLEFLNQS